MQSANDLIAKLYQNGPTEQQTKPSVPAHSPEFLKAVLTSLTKMGLTHSPDRDQYLTWAAGLADLTEDQIKQGILKARDFKGFFNLPAFRELCRVKPEDIGLPDAKAAYMEACRAPSPKAKHTWSHPAVYHAGVLTGWFELSSFAEDDIFPRFRTFYVQLVDRVLSGEAFDAPMMEALPEKVTVILTPEQNQDRMASLRASLNV